MPQLYKRWQYLNHHKIKSVPNNRLRRTCYACGGTGLSMASINDNEPVDICCFSCEGDGYLYFDLPRSWEKGQPLAFFTSEEIDPVVKVLKQGWSYKC